MNKLMASSHSSAVEDEKWARPNGVSRDARNCRAHNKLEDEF